MGILSFRTIAASLALVSLSACGGALTGGAPLDVQLGSAPPDYNPNTGVLSVNGSAIAQRDDRWINAFRTAAVTNQLGTDIFQARTETGNVFAVTYDDINGDSGTIYGRRAVPDFPTSGTSRYVGDYAGLSIRNPDTARAFSAGVAGVAVLNVDYDRDVISGGITTRSVNAANGGPFSNPVSAANVTLGTTGLRSDGTFSGQATAGQFKQSGATFRTINGRFEGLIGENFGGAGEGIAGQLTLTHIKSDGNVYRETGVFTAD